MAMSTPPDSEGPFAAAAEDEDPFVLSQAGQEGVFDQALTNGLTAIVAHDWPGEESVGNGRMLSARALLGVIAKHVTAGSDGVFVIPDPDAGNDHPDSQVSGHALSAGRALPPLNTRIDARILEDALDVSQPARHARGTGNLQRRHIDALLALDDHKSLRTMSEAHADRDWDSAREEDEHAVARAVRFLELIGDEEAARREGALENPNAYHPKLNPDGHDLDTCPVCGYRSFCVQGLDTWGRVPFGQCLVCTYIRSPQTADDEGYREHLAWLDGRN